MGQDEQVSDRSVTGLWKRFSLPMIKLLENSWQLLRAVLRVSWSRAWGFLSGLRKKAADVQNWKRRRAEGYWKEAVELQNTGHFAESIVKWLESAKFESDSSNCRLEVLAHIYNQIGYCSYRIRRNEESKRYYEKALDVYSRLKIFKDADTAYTLNNYALLLLEMGEGERAEELIHDSLRILEKKVGANSPLLTYVMNNMARAYNRLEKYKESEKILVRALEIETTRMVSDAAELVTTLELLGKASYRLRKYDEAEPLFERVVVFREETCGVNDPAVISALFALGLFHSDIGHYEKAEPVFQRCMQILELNYGMEHHFAGVFLNQMGWVTEQQGAYERARHYYERSIAIAEQYVDKYPFELAISLYNGALLSCRQGHCDAAEERLVRSLTFLAIADKTEYISFVEHALSLLLESRGQREQAVFFGKRAIQYVMDREERGKDKPQLLRWVSQPEKDLEDRMVELFESMGRRGEAQAMLAKLLIQRKPVSHLHGKTSEYLRGMWVLNEREQIWDHAYGEWREQAGIWGVSQDDTPPMPSEENEPEKVAPPKAESRFQTLEEVTEGLKIVLETIAQS